MSSVVFEEGKQYVPDAEFIFRENGEFVTKTAYELFGNKRVVLFALPGAFTPTCSNFQVPQYEDRYDQFKELGIDEVYCLSVNDAFVMNAWAKEQAVEKVKFIPDGNADFTARMQMHVSKRNLGFSQRSWRYAVVINNCEIERMFIEPGKVDDATEDPYVASNPDAVIQYLEYVNSKE